MRALCVESSETGTSESSHTGTQDEFITREKPGLGWLKDMVWRLDLLAGPCVTRSLLM
jgi:hypothetical protein